MKKALSLCMALFLSLALFTGCNNGASPPPVPAPPLKALRSTPLLSVPPISPTALLRLSWLVKLEAPPIWWPACMHPIYRRLWVLM